jgi:hypothetical protein
MRSPSAGECLPPCRRRSETGGTLFATSGVRRRPWSNAHFQACPPVTPDCADGRRRRHPQGFVPRLASRRGTLGRPCSSRNVRRWAHDAVRLGRTFHHRCGQRCRAHGAPGRLRTPRRCIRAGGSWRPGCVPSSTSSAPPATAADGRTGSLRPPSSGHDLRPRRYLRNDSVGGGFASWTRCRQPRGVTSADGWSWTASPNPWSPEVLAARGVVGDVASVAEMWVVATYDDFRRAGPDRAAQIRRTLRGSRAA